MDAQTFSSLVDYRQHTKILGFPSSKEEESFDSDGLAECILYTLQDLSKGIGLGIMDFELMQHPSKSSIPKPSTNSGARKFWTEATEDEFGSRCIILFDQTISLEGPMKGGFLQRFSFQALCSQSRSVLSDY
jgi:hypothetical protein